MNITIHPKFIIAKESDLDDICKLHKQVLPHLKWSYDKKYMKTVLNDKRSIMYCLKLDELLVGCVEWYIEKDHILINTIAVNKGFQGLGYGTMIFNFVEEHFIVPGTLWRLMTDERCDIRFWTRKNQEKSHIEYYKRLGYTLYEKGKLWYGFKKEIK